MIKSKYLQKKYNNKNCCKKNYNNKKNNKQNILYSNLMKNLCLKLKNVNIYMIKNIKQMKLISNSKKYNY